MADGPAETIETRRLGGPQAVGLGADQLDAV
jgi:hypothetical protein